MKKSLKTSTLKRPKHKPNPTPPVQTLPVTQVSGQGIELHLTRLKEPNPILSSPSPKSSRPRPNPKPV